MLVLTGLPQESGSADRRVMRSRAALYAAAVRLVSERGTTAVSVTELADAANVSRQVLYTQFGDRDSLLVAAAMDLIRRELVPELTRHSGAAPREQILRAARHLAAHRPYYRVLASGSCAYAVRKALIGAFGSLYGPAAERAIGDLDRRAATGTATFFIGGMLAVVDEWLVDGGDELDPERLTDQLHRLTTSILGP